MQDNPNELRSPSLQSSDVPEVSSLSIVANVRQRAGGTVAPCSFAFRPPQLVERRLRPTVRLVVVAVAPWRTHYRFNSIQKKKDHNAKSITKRPSLTASPSKPSCNTNVDNAVARDHPSMHGIGVGRETGAERAGKGFVKCLSVTTS